ncbi:DUF4274 domain-containing protein, partial [Bacteroides caecigallinarum]|nr:DUF4274 domain-containing protein [Bacteroides caecigallinarum]
LSIKINYNTMYENLSEKRKQELDTLREWAVCAGDDYYFSMAQSDFEKSMKGCENEEFFKAYSRQRKIGMEEFANEISRQITSIHNSEELHYLLESYNYDDGNWTIMQCISHSCCDIHTARMVYWLLSPDYYYDSYTDLEHVPDSDINEGTPKVLKFIEEKALSKGFVHSLTSEYEDEEVPSSNEYTGRIPDSLFAGKD